MTKPTLLSHYNIGISQALFSKLSPTDSATDPLTSAILPYLVGVDTAGEYVFVPSWYMEEPSLKDRLTDEELTELDLIYCLLEDHLKNKGNRGSPPRFGIITPLLEQVV